MPVRCNGENEFSLTINLLFAYMNIAILFFASSPGLTTVRHQVGFLRWAKMGGK
jgi:hypothetical protein